jgi:hypothetical protein
VPEGGRASLIGELEGSNDAFNGQLIDRSAPLITCNARLTSRNSATVDCKRQRVRCNARIAHRAVQISHQMSATIDCE